MCILRSAIINKIGKKPEMKKVARYDIEGFINHRRNDTGEYGER